MGFVRAFSGGAGGRFVQIDWGAVGYQRAILGEAALAKAEMSGLVLTFAAAPGETLSVRGGRARAYLAQRTPESPWQFLQWQDLGSQADLSQGRLRLIIAAPAP